MRLSRTDLVPVLAIVAGGVIGASFSFSFLGSRSNDVPAPGWQPDTEPPVFVMSAIEQSVRGDQIAILPDWVIYRDGETGRHYLVRFTDEEQAAFERIEVLEGQLGYVRERVAELLLRDVAIAN